MTKRMMIIMSVALSFMILFSSIGFAATTGSIRIKVTAKNDIPSGLFIVDIQHTTTTRIDVNNYNFITHTTTVDTTISKSRSNQTGSVTYTITVYNNTKYEYAYRDIYYQSNLSGYNGNSILSDSSGNNSINITTSFPNGKIVKPGEYLTFTATYNLGSSLSRSTNYKNLVNFQFGINVESEAAAIDAVHSKFLDILNTSSTYNTLYEAIDDKFDGYNEWTSNYIGNVSDAVDADSMTVETLFAGQLNMLINGQTKPATVLIKHENLDDNPNTGDDYSVKYNNSSTSTTYRGCEMTLYLTTDGLNTAYGNAHVYVTVFTCDRDENGNIVGDWYNIGDSYLGTAPIVGYRGESGGTGSFVTDNWVASAATYTPVNGYSYTVAQGTTIKDLTRVVDASATAAFQKLLDDAKAIIDDLTYAGTGITVVEDAYHAASRYYTIDETGRAIADATETRAQLIPTMINLDHAITEAREAIDEVLGKQ